MKKFNVLLLIILLKTQFVYSQWTALEKGDNVFIDKLRLVKIISNVQGDICVSGGDFNGHNKKVILYKESEGWSFILDSTIGGKSHSYPVILFDTLSTLYIGNCFATKSSSNGMFYHPPGPTYIPWKELGFANIWGEITDANWFNNQMIFSAYADFKNNLLTFNNSTKAWENPPLVGKTPIFTNFTKQIVVFNSHFYTIGDVTNSLSINNYVLHFDNNQWTQISGFNKCPNTIQVDRNGTLYAAGNFTNSEGKYYVAVYDGMHWKELAGSNRLNANGDIYAICASKNGQIYVAGDFTNKSGYRYVACFDGNKWTELDSLKANDKIWSLYIDNREILYAGGDFTNENGYTYISTNNLNNTLKESNAEDIRLYAYPNPSHDILYISSPKKMDELTVYDVNGKIISEQMIDGFTNQLDVKDFIPGIYYINSSNCKSCAAKFIKF